MVYLHGGAFKRGMSSQYPPDAMMDEPVVLVTIQYRMGILGTVNESKYLFRYKPCF